MRRPALKTFAVSSLGLMIVAASVSCSGASDYVMAPPEFPGRSAPCRVTWSGSQAGSRVIDTIQVTEINGNRIGFEPCPIGYRTSFGQLRFTVFVRGDCRQIGSFNYSPTTCNSGSGNDQWRVFRRFPNVTDIWYPVGSGFYRWAPAPAGAPVLRYDASVSLTITSEADSSRDSIVIGFDHRRVDNSLAEPPRVWRRPPALRDWEHDTTDRGGSEAAEAVLARSPGAGGAAGAGAAGST